VSSAEPALERMSRALARAPASVGRPYGLGQVEQEGLQVDRLESEFEERTLVGRAKGGDRRAFEQLIRMHADHLYAVVSRLCASPQEAEEVTQEAFVRAWRGIGAFDGRSRLFTWLYRIGVNEAKRQAERSEGKPHAVSLQDAPSEPPDLREAPDLRVENNDLRAALAQAVRDLPLAYRAPLVLRDIEGLSTAEGAEILGLGEAAFKSRLHRARTAIRKALGDRLREGSDR
jgi:RNA polymerase sigma-70 factor (ECF subfamily)